MFAFRRQRLNLPLAPLAAALAALGCAGAILALPTPLIESVVRDSGLPALVAAAEPPLGLTARMAMALGTSSVAALFAWSVFWLLFGGSRLTLGGAEPEDSDDPWVATPVLRRADAHPDAPPRPPVLATRDLGTPFLEVTARKAGHAEPQGLPISPRPAPPRPPTEQPLPADLDQPLAAFDPDSIPEVPLPPPVVAMRRSRSERPQLFTPDERFETFELTPPATPEPQPEERIAAPETDATIHALLARLERGISGRAQPPAPPTPPAPQTRAEAEHGLQEALVTLRNLARRA